MRAVFPVPLHLQECFVALGYEKGDFSIAELAASQVLALSLYAELTLDQQDSIVSAIGEFFLRLVFPARRLW